MPAQAPALGEEGPREEGPAAGAAEEKGLPAEVAEEGLAAPVQRALCGRCSRT